MEKLYANKIIREHGLPNAFTIDNVRADYVQKTILELEKRGYDGYGAKI